MPVSSDLCTKKNNVQLIAILDIIIATLTLIFNSRMMFQLVNEMQQRSININSKEGAVFLFTIVSIVVTIIQWFVAKNLVTGTNRLGDKPKKTMRSCSNWRRWSVFFILLLVVLTFGLEKLNLVPGDKLYLLAIALEIIFRLFGISYIGIFERDVKKCWIGSAPTFISIPADLESQATTIITISDHSS